MTFLQGLDVRQYADPKDLYTPYIISAAKEAKNPLERAEYCSMLSSLDSVDFYTVSYTYTEQRQFNLYKSSSCVSATPTQNRVPQGVGVRFPPRPPAFAAPQLGRASQLDIVGGAAKAARRSPKGEDGLRQCDTSICSRALGFQTKQRWIIT